MGDRTFHLVSWKEAAAVACVAQFVGHCPTKWKGAGSIPGQGMCLYYRPGPHVVACKRQLIDVSLLLSPSLPLSLKINKIFFKRRKLWNVTWDHIPYKIQALENERTQIEPLDLGMSQVVHLFWEKIYQMPNITTGQKLQTESVRPGSRIETYKAE